MRTRWRQSRSNPANLVRGGPRGEVLTCFRRGEGWAWCIKGEDGCLFSPETYRTRREAKDAVMFAVRGE